LAIICDVQRLGPQYEAKKVYFEATLQTSWVGDNPVDHTTSAGNIYRPWHWTLIEDAAGGDDAVERTKSWFAGRVMDNGTARWIPLPSLRVVQRNEPVGNAHQAPDEAVNILSADALVWRPTRAVDAEPVNEMTLRDMLASLSRAPFVLSETLKLTFVLSADEAEVDPAKYERLIVAPQFSVNVGGPTWAFKSDENFEGLGDVRDLLKWQYKPGSEANQPEAAAYLKPLALDPKAAAIETGKVDRQTLWITGTSNNPVEDWSDKIELRLTQTVDVAQHLLEALRSRLDLRFESAKPGPVREEAARVYADELINGDGSPLNRITHGFVNSLRDLAGLGLRRQPDGTCALDDLLLGADSSKFAETEPGSISGRLSIRTACEMWDSNVDSAKWRSTLKLVLTECSDSAALADDPIAALRGQSTLADDLARARYWLASLAALHSAATEETNLVRLFLHQATEAVTANKYPLPQQTPRPPADYLTDVPPTTQTDSDQKSAVTWKSAGKLATATIGAAPDTGPRIKLFRYTGLRGGRVAIALGLDIASASTVSKARIALRASSETDDGKLAINDYVATPGNWLVFDANKIDAPNALDREFHWFQLVEAAATTLDVILDVQADVADAGSIATFVQPRVGMLTNERFCAGPALAPDPMWRLDENGTPHSIWPLKALFASVSSLASQPAHLVYRTAIPASPHGAIEVEAKCKTRSGIPNRSVSVRYRHIADRSQTVEQTVEYAMNNNPALGVIHAFEPQRDRESEGDAFEKYGVVYQPDVGSIDLIYSVLDAAGAADPDAIAEFRGESVEAGISLLTADSAGGRSEGVLSVDPTNGSCAVLLTGLKSAADSLPIRLRFIDDNGVEPLVDYLTIELRDQSGELAVSCPNIPAASQVSSPREVSDKFPLLIHIVADDDAGEWRLTIDSLPRPDKANALLVASFEQNRQPMQNVRIFAATADAASATIDNVSLLASSGTSYEKAERWALDHLTTRFAAVSLSALRSGIEMELEARSWRTALARGALQRIYRDLIRDVYNLPLRLIEHLLQLGRRRLSLWETGAALDAGPGRWDLWSDHRPGATDIVAAHRNKVLQETAGLLKVYLDGRKEQFESLIGTAPPAGSKQPRRTPQPHPIVRDFKNVQPLTEGDESDRTDVSRFISGLGLLVRRCDPTGCESSGERSESAQWHCVSLGEVQLTYGDRTSSDEPVQFPSDVVLAEPIAREISYVNGRGTALISYLNGSIIGDSNNSRGKYVKNQQMDAPVAANLATATQITRISTVNIHRTAHDPDKSASPHRLPQLVFGSTIQTALFAMSNVGALPSEIADGHPTRLKDAPAPPESAIACTKYLRLVGVAQPTLLHESIASESLKTTPTPSTTFPLAGDLFCTELPGPLVLTTPPKARGKPGESSWGAVGYPMSSVRRFRVGLPRVTLETWLAHNWLTADRETKLQFLADRGRQADKALPARSAANAVFVKGISRRDLSVDDPAVDGLLFRVTSVFPNSGGKSSQEAFVRRKDLGELKHAKNCVEDERRPPILVETQWDSLESHPTPSIKLADPTEHGGSAAVIAFHRVRPGLSRKSYQLQLETKGGTKLIDCPPPAADSDRSLREYARSVAATIMGADGDLHADVLPGEPVRVLVRERKPRARKFVLWVSCPDHDLTVDHLPESQLQINIKVPEGQVARLDVFAAVRDGSIEGEPKPVNGDGSEDDSQSTDSPTLARDLRYRPNPAPEVQTEEEESSEKEESPKKHVLPPKYEEYTDTTGERFVLCAQSTVILESAAPLDFAFVNGRAEFSNSLWNRLEPTASDRGIEVFLNRIWCVKTDPTKKPFCPVEPVKAELANAPERILSTVGRMQLHQQIWYWQGRSQSPFPFHTPCDQLDALPTDPNERQRIDAPVLWDAEGFAARADSNSALISARPSALSAKPLIHHERLANEPRVRYDRYGIEVWSRYEGITPERPIQAFPSKPANPDNDGARTRWRRVRTHCKERVDTPPPSVRLILPLTQTVTADKPAFLVVLTEPWYDHAGLAEELLAEVEYETIGEVTKDPNPGKNPWCDESEAWRDLVKRLGRAPLIGPDAAVSGAKSPSNDAQHLPPLLLRLRSIGPIGHTLDTDTPEALQVNSSFIIEPDSDLDALSDKAGTPDLPDLAWYMARVSVRRRLATDAFDPTLRTVLSPDMPEEQRATEPDVATGMGWVITHQLAKPLTTGKLTLSLRNGVNSEETVVSLTSDAGQADIHMLRFEIVRLHDPPPRPTEQGGPRPAAFRISCFIRRTGAWRLEQSWLWRRPTEWPGVEAHMLLQTKDEEPVAITREFEPMRISAPTPGQWTAFLPDSNVLYVATASDQGTPAERVPITSPDLKWEFGVEIDSAKLCVQYKGKAAFLKPPWLLDSSIKGTWYYGAVVTRVIADVTGRRDAETYACLLLNRELSGAFELPGNEDTKATKTTKIIQGADYRARIVLIQEREKVAGGSASNSWWDSLARIPSDISLDAARQEPDVPYRIVSVSAPFDIAAPE